ncbi:hypothetical protein BV898_08039 [Hypsibius exemplaris]|uniref:G-protein coupled receptors family 1 profile domain-containing protein n=1 Tax=Hypsibius exemplaris TaxID=2072580 RepID=A0A1W0WRT7_HYPEX|nr:hypothetical protein BV898_08039 [Hypsibius exemplaris]
MRAWYHAQSVLKHIATTTPFPYPKLRTAVPYILILLCISILIANAVVLAAFIKNRHLRTPFNMYIISLVIADLTQTLLDLPFTVMSQFIPVWPLGHLACNFRLYGLWVFSAIVRNTHSLISLNRLWALFLPVSYRHYHTNTLAICVEQKKENIDIQLHAPNAEESGKAEKTTTAQDRRQILLSCGVGRSTQNFVILTYLVVGAIFCWTPVVVAYTLAIVMGYYEYLHFTIASLLYYFNSLLDPIFFTMAMAPLRVTIYSMFKDDVSPRHE